MEERLQLLPREIALFPRSALVRLVGRVVTRCRWRKRAIPALTPVAPLMPVAPVQAFIPATTASLVFIPATMWFRVKVVHVGVPVRGSGFECTLMLKNV